MFRTTRKPSENFALIIKVVRFCCGLIGADISNPKYRMNWKTYIVIACILVYLICTILNIIKLFDENPTYLLEALCMMGSVLQGISKLVSGCLYTKKISELRLEIENVYAQYQEKGSSYYVILQKSCRRSWKILVGAGWINVVLLTIFLLTPFFALWITGKLQPLMSFEIPGLDVKTSHGYIVTTAIHGLCIFVGAFGLFAGDMFVLIFLSHALLFADIFEEKISDINKRIADGNQGNQTKSMLEDFIEWHKKYNAFNDNCNYAFYYIIAVQITTAGISIVCTLYIFLFGDWPGAYTYVLYPICGIYAYCFLGTQINSCNTRFIDAIYNIDWFMLPVPEQKLVLMMLMKAQTPSEIQIGGVIPLSVSTGLQITKYIYSIFMMMVKCIADEEH